MRGSRSIRIFLTSAALAAVAGCGLFSHSRGTLGPAGPDLPALQSVGLNQAWQRQVRMEPGERVKKAWRVGGSIYIATTESRLVRIDARQGVLKWGVGLGRENFDIYKPIELKDPEGSASTEVLVVTRGEAFIFNLETGDEKRTARLGMSVSSDPVVIGNTLCVGGADTFYGLYLDHLGMKHWRLPAPGDMFLSAPVAMDNNVIVGSRNGRLWRISADSGQWDWKDRKTNGIIAGGLAADYNAVYVPCEDQRVYAFRTDTGGELWERQLDDRFEEAPVLAGPVVLATSVKRHMSALARPTGEIRWTMDQVAQVGTVTQETAWILDTGGMLHHVALETGEMKAVAPVPGVQMLLRNNDDANVILVTYAGLVGMYAPRPEN